MSIKGSSYVRFQRALQHGNLTVVRGAAAELASLTLTDALAVLLLIAEQDPGRYPRAAARWIAKLTHERREVDLTAQEDVLGALCDLPTLGRGPINALCVRYGIDPPPSRQRPR